MPVVPDTRTLVLTKAPVNERQASLNQSVLGPDRDWSPTLSSIAARVPFPDRRRWQLWPKGLVR
jgi:hypothetical protein